MWMLHFLSHLKEGGTAGFVMAAGELSNANDNARLEVRKHLIEQDYVDCIVQLTGQLFANTQVPCSLWFLSKNRKGGGGYRKRTGEVLFIDARKLGTLMPGSRKQRQLSAEEVEAVAKTYRQFKRSSVPEHMRGFCTVATLADIGRYDFSLAPGRYVGSLNIDDESEPLESRLTRLTSTLDEHFARGAQLADEIKSKLRTLVYE
jgi:type I restriction enzyme M protein